MPEGFLSIIFLGDRYPLNLCTIRIKIKISFWGGRYIPWNYVIMYRIVKSWINYGIDLSVKGGYFPSIIIQDGQWVGRLMGWLTCQITHLCAVSYTLQFGNIWDLRNALVGNYVMRTLFRFEVNKPLDRLQRLLRLKN